MLPLRPDEWPGLFERHLNVGDLDGVMALYEPGASLVTPSGETVVGHDAVRAVLAGLIGIRTQLHGRVVKTITAGDVALLYTDWQGTATDPSGQSRPSTNKAIELVRRQSDGTWTLIAALSGGPGTLAGRGTAGRVPARSREGIIWSSSRQRGGG